MRQTDYRYVRIFLLLATSFLVVSYLFYQVRVADEEAAFKATEVARLAAQQQAITAIFATVATDLQMLANHHEFELLTLTHPESREALQAEFLTFSQYKRIYDQIRFIDTTGKEVIRVRYASGSATALPEEELQFRTDRPYFREAITLEKEQVFCSPFELAREGENVTQPLKPIIRFATPVYDRQGWKKGIMVLNYLGAELLAGLQPRAPEPGGSSLLLNSEGYWLKGVNPEDEWGFMFADRLERTLARRSPETWAKMVAADTGQFTAGSDLITFTTIYPRQALAGQSPEPAPAGGLQSPPAPYFWKLVSLVPATTLALQTERPRHSFFLVSGLGLLVLAGLAWFFARSRGHRREAEAEALTYQHLVTSSVDHICLLTRDHRFQAVNDSFLRAIGKNRAEVVGHKLGEVLGGQPLQRTLQQGIDQAVSGATQHAEEWLAAPDGTKRFLSLTFQPVRAPAAPISEVALTCRDETELKESREQARILAELPEQNPNPVLRISSAGLLLYANPAADHLREHRLCQVGETLPASFLEKLQSEPGSGPQRRTIELTIGGRAFSFLIVPIPATDLFYLYGQDITAQNEYEAQLLLLASIFDNTVEGIAITNPDGLIEKVNPGFCAITGYGAEEVIGKNPRILKSERQDESFYKKMWQDILDTGFWSGEIWNRRKNGEAYPERLSITTIKDSSGAVAHYVAVFYDISEIKRGEEELHYQYYHDALTGLPNRQLFLDRLEMALSLARRTGQMLAILLLGMDNFKDLNTSLGHHLGDLLLQKIGHILQLTCRMEDTVARLGGDEFIVMLTGIRDETAAFEMAERLMAALIHPVMIAEHKIFISASIGITLYPTDGAHSEELVKNAELALSRAKATGKNNYKLFTEALNKQVTSRLHLESNLRNALAQQEFLVHYQPKVSLATGAIVGTEALVRWQRSDGQLVSPLDFIPLAENTGLIIPLGEWVLKTACAQTKQWHEQGFPLGVAVNLSPRQFHQKNLVEMIMSSLTETGMPATALELEITEGLAMDNVEQSIEILKTLRQMRIRFSIDDFGTGYSSLQYLKRLPINCLKIDRAFVRDLPDNEDDVAITSATISMAHSLGLQVVAEGVENMEQLRFLRERGCEQIQGYLFSKPVAAAVLLGYLREGKRLSVERLPHWSGERTE